MMADPQDTLTILKSMPAATLWEAAGKRGDISPRIKPLFPEARVAGPAFTVKMFPGETYAVVRAVHEAPPGSVIVIDAGAAERGATWGGTVTLAAKRKGINGVVTNGTVRDLGEVLEHRLPVFAIGSSLVAGLRGHRGWLNVPISIGEAVVNPGDFIVGDLDGVVVISAAEMVETAQRAVERREAEEERERRLLAGESLLDILQIG
jgi:4-hydroxy-4-methyl-2-oxoglutarate aldolase